MTDVGHRTSPRSSVFDDARLRWIETWAKGWRSFIRMRRVAAFDSDYYAQLPLDVAVEMIEELVTVLKSPEWALHLLAEELMESGGEIGEMIERIRFDRSANAAEVSRG